LVRAGISWLPVAVSAPAPCCLDPQYLQTALGLESRQFCVGKVRVSVPGTLMKSSWGWGNSCQWCLPRPGTLVICLALGSLFSYSPGVDSHWGSHSLAWNVRTGTPTVRREHREPQRPCSPAKRKLGITEFLVMPPPGAANAPASQGEPEQTPGL
jgi:hypothetical protein